jgi:hypothetical protein
MNALVVFATGVSQMPVTSIIPVVYLPQMWMRVAYLVTIFVIIPLWIGIHAWIVLHQRQHNAPPRIVLWLYQKMKGVKPGKRLIGSGRHG